MDDCVKRTMNVTNDIAKMVNPKLHLALDLFYVALEDMALRELTFTKGEVEQLLLSLIVSMVKDLDINEKDQSEMLLSMGKVLVYFSMKTHEEIVTESLEGWLQELAEKKEGDV